MVKIQNLCIYISKLWWRDSFFLLISSLMSNYALHLWLGEPFFFQAMIGWLVAAIVNQLTCESLHMLSLSARVVFLVKIWIPLCAWEGAVTSSVFISHCPASGQNTAQKTLQSGNKSEDVLVELFRNSNSRKSVFNAQASLSLYLFIFSWGSRSLSSVSRFWVVSEERAPLSAGTAAAGNTDVDKIAWTN